MVKRRRAGEDFIFREGEKGSFSPCLLSNGIFGRWKLIWRIDRLRVYFCIRLNFDFSGSRKYKRWRGEREIFRKGEGSKFQSEHTVSNIFFSTSA